METINLVFIKSTWMQPLATGTHVQNIPVPPCSGAQQSPDSDLCVSLKNHLFNCRILVYLSLWDVLGIEICLPYVPIHQVESEFRIS